MGGPLDGSRDELQECSLAHWPPDPEVSDMLYRVAIFVECLFITYVKGTFFGMSESGEASKWR